MRDNLASSPEQKREDLETFMMWGWQDLTVVLLCVMREKKARMASNFTYYSKNGTEEKEYALRIDRERECSKWDMVVLRCLRF